MKASVKVHGMVAGGREDVIAHVGEGWPVLCIPEPTNPHDPHAVAVYVAPRHKLTRPEELVSSVADPEGLGWVHPHDRKHFRQVGYLPRGVAAQFTLPDAGLVGWVSAVRDAPVEYDGAGRMLPPRTAGIDVTVNLPARQPQEATR